MIHDTFPNRLNRRIWRVLRFPFMTKCPACRVPISQFKLSKTNPRRKWTPALPYVCCPSCSAKLKCGTGYRAPVLALLQLLAFLFGFFAGFAFFTSFELTSYYHETRGHREPTFFAFILTWGLGVLPSMHLVRKFMKVEVVE